MKLVKFSSWVTFMFWMLIAIVVAVFLSEIIDAVGTDEVVKNSSLGWEEDFRSSFWNSRSFHPKSFPSDGFQPDDSLPNGYFDPNQMVRVFPTNAFIKFGEPTPLAYFVVFLIGFVLASFYAIPPYIRAKNIESGYSRSKGLIYGWVVFHILTGFMISGVIMLVGVLADDSETYNSEYSNHDEKIYYRGATDEDYDSPYEYNRSNNLHGRVEDLENEVRDLSKQYRKSRYDIDDELDYMNRRNNRKFRDLDDDIDDLHDEVQSIKYPRGRRRR